MPPRRRAATVEAPCLEDYLTYETNPKHTPQALYTHMQSVPDLPQALGAGPASLDVCGPALYMIGESELIGHDPFIPLILSKLKDPRLPINAMQIWHQNFLLADPPLIRAISSFPNVCVLHLCDFECSEDQFISLIRSYPNLRHLKLDKVSIREYESGSRAHADPVEAISVNASEIRDGQRGSEIKQISIYVDNTTGWALLDLFASHHSPVALRNLTVLILPHDTNVICNDTNFVSRISRLIISPLAPLDLGPSIHEVRISILITGNYKTKMLNGWASTLNQLTHPRHLSIVTIVVVFDLDHIARKVWNNFPTDIPGWAALDQALDRPQLTVREVEVCIMERDNMTKRFGMSAASTWISTNMALLFGIPEDILLLALQQIKLKISAEPTGNVIPNL
ncbi:hypothetical protein IW261DRAFT_1597004 [Armillaria novae-zelandiae]|uniref:F-box domain-containing protein n=1 Tax=Armillaria novae-zelandiae TaxID=153914 RepID=A0AA39NU92_9AGAR|nr:hypothetical protein IW261DRAFT_1597004 [Armillaria novae-zelandiae]